MLNGMFSTLWPGAGVEGFRGIPLNPSFDSYFHCHGKVWINLINLGHLSLYFSSTSSSYYLSMCVQLLDEWQTVQAF